MTRFLLASVVFSAGLASAVHAAPEMPSREAPVRESAAATFRAPDLTARHAIALDAPLEKSADASQEQPAGRLRVATVRALAKSARLDQWNALADGYVTRVEASSAGAEGLRAQLDVASLTATLEVRVQGADGRIEVMTVEPGRAPEAWTPWTEGASQTIELFSRVPQDVRVGSLLHFTLSPYAKAAGTCTVPTACSTHDVTLDAAIAQRKKSVMRINFVEGGSGYVCTATLINTERFPAAYVLTANHCIGSAAAANSITSLWFYESTTCDAASAVSPGQVQVAGGMQLVFTNHNVDSTLLLMPAQPPSGATYSGWNAARLNATGAAVTSLSHPQGDTARIALGATSNDFRIIGRPQDMYGVRFTRGIIQGGSSGSGIFTLSGGGLQLRGVLSGTTIRQAGGMSCTNLEEDALYGRFEIFHPEIEQYIRTTGQASDDAPNRPQDFAPAGGETALNMRSAATISHDGRRIDYAGDVDLYRFVLTAPAAVSAWTEGANLDTVGNILDIEGVNIEANDDEQVADNHFGITRYLQAGTYYVQVAHFDAAGTGSYNLRIRADEVEEVNHTALWWNAAESGWGLNVNHQGNKIFATLFTYDASGPMWLVMSDGQRQADGSYAGALYRTTGPAFNAVPFTAASVTSVGTMRLAFSGSDNASLTYTVDGTTVSKSLTRQAFGTVANCSWSAFDRSFAQNYQDLWFNPAEPGWGVNITHQDSTIFATLFTYEANGRGLWLVMSAGAANSSGGFSGPLYRTAGPVFNTTPWTPTSVTQVGTMTFTPTDGNAATLTYSYNNVNVTKQVQRQVFGAVRPLCE